MTASQHLQRRVRQRRPDGRWLAVAIGVMLTAVVFSLAADLRSAAVGITGAAALSALCGAGVGAAVVRTQHRGVRSPAAQWKAYSESLIQLAPAQLPPRSSTFCGRLAELQDLQTRHRRWRDGRDRQTGGAGPVMIFMHGMPGIGKSAVAQNLAHLLAEHYPDGQLYANLGVAGAPRPPAEILRGFLPALGWDEELIPESTAERAQLFRILTRRKRILILLDAARDPAQLRDLMPSTTLCTVIVTSRRDLSPAFGARSVQLTPLTRDDAVTLMAAVTSGVGTFDLAAATEIVDTCGGHPLALRAVADIVGQQRTSLAELAGELRRPGGLAKIVDNPGRDLRGRLISEYRRLAPDHQHAFRLLSVVGARTFVPWVLGPACEVKLPEAENLLAALASAQFVLAAGRDGVTGIDRYELTPVACQLASSLVTDDDAVEEARERLDEGYLEAAVRVLRELDPEFAAMRPAGEGRWLPNDVLFPGRIAEQGQAKAWVREEYKNLLRAMRTACHTGDHELGASIAAWLGGCAPRGVDAEDILTAFDTALQSASLVGTAARIDVLLARGAYRTAQECYGKAFQDFGEALALCHFGARTDPNGFVLRLAAVERRCGEAYLRAGEFTPADERFRRALALAEGSHETSVGPLRSLLATLRYLADPRTGQLPTADESATDDELAYWSALAKCDDAASRQDWDVAEQTFASAANNYRSDLRRAATLSYWQSRLLLSASRRRTELSRQARRKYVWRTVRAAHSSLHDHELLGDEAGQVRAHCVLLSAYLAMDDPNSAEHHLRRAREARDRADTWLDKVSNPLDALLHRGAGEMLRYSGQAEAGLNELRHAATMLAANGDVRGVAEIASLTGDDVGVLLKGNAAEVCSDAALRAFLVDGLPLTPGHRAALRVEIDGAHLRRYCGAVTGEHVTVLMFASNAKVSPQGESIDLTAVHDDRPVFLDFGLWPRSPGPVSVQVQLHALEDGVLLQEFDSSLPAVVISMQEAA